MNITKNIAMNITSNITSNITKNINFYYTENVFSNDLNLSDYLHKEPFYLDNFENLDNIILEIKDIKNDDYDLDNMFLEVKDIKIYQINYFIHFEIE
jgi:hypothetical protein